MTVIFSNAGDEDCELLRNLWKDIDNVNIIEVKWESFVDEKIERVNAAISQEEDFLIFCGHGSPRGLFGPVRGGLLLSDENMHLIKARQVIFLWCYAADFCQPNHLHGLSSSMFISNTDEAYYNGINGYSQEEINETNVNTYNLMNKLIRKGIPLCEWCDPMMNSLDQTNAIDAFNRGGLIYFE